MMSIEETVSLVKRLISIKAITDVEATGLINNSVLAYLFSEDNKEEQVEQIHDVYHQPIDILRAGKYPDVNNVICMYGVVMPTSGDVTIGSNNQLDNILSEI